MKLTNPTDRALDLAFAQSVAGWTEAKTDKKCCYNSEGNHCYWSDVPEFTHSADAVLPWLEGETWFYVETQSCTVPTTWVVSVSTTDGLVKAQGPSFPRAAVIALLRAHGVEVEFTIMEARQ